MVEVGQSRTMAPIQMCTHDKRNICIFLYIYKHSKIATLVKIKLRIKLKNAKMARAKTKGN